MGVHDDMEKACMLIIDFMCLGEVGSGKTTLVAKLQGVEEYMKGRGLEYLYFNVHDDDIDGNQQPHAVYDISCSISPHIPCSMVIWKCVNLSQCAVCVFRPHQV